MTQTHTRYQFNIVFWLNILSALFLVLKYVGVLNWDIGWCLLPWFVALALWLWGKLLVLLARRVIRRAKAEHPAFQR